MRNVWLGLYTALVLFLAIPAGAVIRDLCTVSSATGDETLKLSWADGHWLLIARGDEAVMLVLGSDDMKRIRERYRESVKRTLALPRDAKDDMGGVAGVGFHIFNMGGRDHLVNLSFQDGAARVKFTVALDGQLKNRKEFEHLLEITNNK